MPVRMVFFLERISMNYADLEGERTIEGGRCSGCDRIHQRPQQTKTQPHSLVGAMTLWCLSLQTAFGTYFVENACSDGMTTSPPSTRYVHTKHGGSDRSYVIVRIPVGGFPVTKSQRLPFGTGPRGPKELTGSGLNAKKSVCNEMEFSTAQAKKK
ncbi:hypothetical protein BDV28DRAFT_139935 [Aspergillus coremiiformis]|uniref:Uncharacterized protein n=1 Tax=Aspergillus coremiiformis TaxID=138285 RepID=A0A5N6YZA5_9EURO|nr:hypothetical protein BDV28DRAFT_139935 [Aspergillus coremiiformis]